MTDAARCTQARRSITATRYSSCNSMQWWWSWDISSTFSKLRLSLSICARYCICTYHFLQLEILVTIQCNDDDEDQTSHVQLYICKTAFLWIFPRLCYSTSQVLQLENLVNAGEESERVSSSISHRNILICNILALDVEVVVNCCMLCILQNCITIASYCTVAADGKWSHLDFLTLSSAMQGEFCTATSSRQVVEIPNWWSVDVAKRLVTSQLKPLLSSSAGWDWST